MATSSSKVYQQISDNIRARAGGREPYKPYKIQTSYGSRTVGEQEYLKKVEERRRELEEEKQRKRQEEMKARGYTTPEQQMVYNQIQDAKDYVAAIRRQQMSANLKSAGDSIVTGGNKPALKKAEGISKRVLSDISKNLGLKIQNEQNVINNQGRAEDDPARLRAQEELGKLQDRQTAVWMKQNAAQQKSKKQEIKTLPGVYTKEAKEMLHDRDSRLITNQDDYVKWMMQGADAGLLDKDKEKQVRQYAFYYNAPDAKNSREYSEYFRKGIDQGIFDDGDDLGMQSTGKLQSDLADLKRRKAQAEHNSKNSDEINDELYKTTLNKDVFEDLQTRGLYDADTGERYFKKPGSYDEIRNRAIGEFWRNPVNQTDEEVSHHFDALLYDTVHGKGEYDRVLYNGTDEEFDRMDAEIQDLWQRLESRTIGQLGDQYNDRISELQGAAYGRESNLDRDIRLREEELKRRETVGKYGDLEGAAYNPSLISPETAENYYTNLMINQGDAGPQGNKTEWLYWLINNVSGAEHDYGEGFLGELTNVQQAEQSYRKYSFMTDEMIGQFNALYEAGKTAEAQAFLDAVDPYITQMAAGRAEELRYNASKGMFGGLYGAMTILRQPIAGLEGTIGSLAAIFGNEDAKNPNSNWYRLQRMNTTTRGARKESWGNFFADKFGEQYRGAGEWLNGVTYSMADNIMAMAITKGAGVAFGFDKASKAATGVMQFIMSSSASASKMVEKLDSGMDPTEAAIYALGDGIIEAITEKYSIEALLHANMKELLGNPRQILKYIGKNTLAETTEEGASNILGTTFDELMSRVFGHESELTAEYNALISQGMGEKEASRQVWNNWRDTLLSEMLAGGVSGFFLSGGNVALNTISQHQAGAKIRNKSNTVAGKTGVDQLIEAARGMDADTESHRLAEELNEKVQSGKKVSSGEAGRLAQNILYETNEMAGNIARDTIERMVRDTMKENGATPEQIERTAGIVTDAVVKNKKLTKGEMATVAEVKQAIEAYRHLMTNEGKLEAGMTVRMNPEGDVTRSVRETVGRLLNGESAEKVDHRISRDIMEGISGMVLANEEDLANVQNGKRTKTGMDAIVDNEIVQVTGKEGDSYIVKTADGTEKKVSAAAVTAVDTMAGAIMAYTEGNGKSVLGDKAFGTITKGAEQNKKMAPAKYIAEAMKIYMAARTGGQMPGTTMAENTANDIWSAAQEENKQATQDRQAAGQLKVEAGKGTASFDGAEYGTDAWKEKIRGLSKQIRNQMGAVAEYAKRIGLHVDFINDPENEAIFGSEDRSTGRITINVAGREADLKVGGKTVLGENHHLLVVASHEFTHWLEQNSTESYDELRQFIFDKIRGKGQSVEALVMKKIDAYRSVAKQDLSVEDAMAEIVADACDQVLGSEKVAREIEQSNPNLYSKIKSFVTNLVARIRAAAAGMSTSASAEARLLQDWADELEDRWLKTLQEAQGRGREQNESVKTGESKKKFSLDQYTEAEKANIGKSKNTIIYDGNRSTFTKFYNSGLNAKSDFEKMYFGKIDKALASRIKTETGYDLEGYNVALSNHEIKKIAVNRHGNPIKEALMGQVVIGEQELFDAIQVITDADSIKADPKGYIGNPAIIFVKNINGVETVATYAATKAHDLRIQTVYKGVQSNKNGSLSTAGGVTSPSLTPVTTRGTTSNSILPNQGNTVNKHSIQQRDVDVSDWKNYTVRDGEMYMKDQKGNETKLTGLDREYVEAWKKSNFTRMEEILADKIRSNGAIPFKTPNSYSTPNHKWIANAIKEGNTWAIRQAAAEMAQMVPKNAVLVPMPNHHGETTDDTDTVILANEISKITDRPVIRALAGVERESRKEDKAKPKSQQMKAEDLGFTQVEEIPEGTVPYFVDNVIASGLTAEAAHRALGNNGVTLAYAKSTRSANDGLKRANVTFYDTNKQYGSYLIPLSERIDMSRKGYAGTKFSIQQDSEGRQLSPQQQEFFKDSKVVDENGNLLRMYHGTNAEFYEFDREMIGSTGRFEGSGFNFTPYEGRAKSYGGNVMTGYLNIRNPLSSQKKTISVAKLAQLIRESDPTGDNIISDYARETRDYGSRSFVIRESMTAARSVWESSDNDVDIYSYISAADSDAVSLINTFEKMGYDGLIHYDDNGKIKTAIAFNSNQFKNVDNTEPTENPDIRFSIRQGDMEINRWMQGLTASSLQTEQERTMLKQWQETMGSLNMARHAVYERRAELAKLEAKPNPTAYEKHEMSVKRSQLEVWQKKVDRYETSLAKATSEKGFAAIMRKQSRIMNDLVNGRTADEVRGTVDAINAELETVQKEMEARKERLKQLAAKEAVIRIRQQLNSAGLKRIAAKLKSDLNSELSNTEIENRLALMALKMKEGNIDEEDVTELADMLIGKMRRTYDSYILDELRGRTITMSQSQQKELKGQNRTIREIRQELAGTGIRIDTKGGNTLDKNWSELCDLIPTLDREAADKDMLDQLLNVITAEKDAARNQYAANMDMEVAGMVIDAASNLVPEIVTDKKSMQLIRETLNFIAEMSTEAEESAKALEELNSLMARLQKKGGEAKSTLGKLESNIHDAITYNNELSTQSEQANWLTERRKLIDQLKSEHTQEMLRQQAEFKLKIEKDKTARSLMNENMALRRRIHTNISRIRNLLMKESVKQNVPEHMKGLAREMLDRIVRNDMSGRKITGMDLKMLQETRRVLDAWEKQDGKYNPEQLKGLDEAVQDAVYNALEDIKAGIDFYNASTRGSELQVNLQAFKNALTRISDGVSAITGIINAERSIALGDRRVAVEDQAYKVQESAGDKRAKELTGSLGRTIAALRKAVTSGNLTPEYFFKMLKNAGLNDLWEEYHRAENRNGLELAKSKAKLDEIAQKYGYKNWDTDARQEVKLASGSVNMTLGQIMSLYATWKREHTLGPAMSQHLQNGGFYVEEYDPRKGIIGRRVMDLKAHRVTEADMEMVNSLLTDEQKKFVDDIVAYMSTDMSELGNEASMKAYGIRMYKESYYFPFKMWDGIKARASNDSGSAAAANDRAFHPSFSKTRLHGANNALMLGDFMTTAADHIVGMINYATMGLANENLQKVLNAQVPEGERLDQMTRRTIRTVLEEAYGRAATEYLAKLQEQLNGGAVRVDRTIYDRMLTLFRKNAVAGSMSVALQQPLSYIRAAMMINPKYMTEALAREYWKGSYQERLKHSGVSVIKDMGRFDMGFGQGAREYITPEGKEGKVRQVWDAITDKATILPELMDRWTWNRLWVAVKAEQHDLHPDMDVHSDEFLDMVGERFNDIVRKTQVYDSTLTKSQNMRSQNPFVKSITSFMAEPTLTLNVLADAAQNVKEKGGKLKLAKALATFALSAMAQAAAKALMSTGRTPDDKKTWMENYLYRYYANLINEGDPLNLIPGYNDMITLLKNGKLEDDAMGVLGKLFTAGDKLAGAFKEGAGYRDVEDSFGQIVQLFTQLPAKNIMRDMRAMYNWFIGKPYADRPDSAAVIRLQTVASMMTADNLIGVISAKLGEAGYKVNNTAYYDRMYNAIQSGNKQEADAIREYLTLGKGVKEETIDSNMRTMTRNGNLFPALEANKAAEIAKAIKELQEYGSEVKDIKSAITKEMKPKYLAADHAGKVKIRDAIQKAYKAMGLTAEDADKVINGWKEDK